MVGSHGVGHLSLMTVNLVSVVDGQYQLFLIGELVIGYFIWLMFKTAYPSKPHVASKGVNILHCCELIYSLFYVHVVTFPLWLSWYNITFLLQKIQL